MKTMMNRNGLVSRMPVLVSALLLVSTPVLAQTDAKRVDDLEARVAALTAELASLKSELDDVKQTGATSDATALRSDVDAARQAADSAAEWKNPTAVQHFAGYASADYVNPQNGPAVFSANFNPVFHYLHDDKVLWEAELEVETAEDGTTDVGLEYTSVDLFLNDNLTLVAGKFLSPIGNFRQNLHPTWVNKLPSAPPGFGHHGAAPVSDFGLQLRGVAPVGDNSRFVYAAYFGNGPKIVAEDGEIHEVEAEGLASDPDGKKIVGGRVGFLPFPALELGVSAAVGDVRVAEADGVEIEGDPTRNYSVLDFDASYRWNGLELRGEYVKQKVADKAFSIVPDGGDWKTWYAQAAYRFGSQSQWEAVGRYTDFNSPHPDDSQEQVALGINYLITPSAMFKVAYESNSGEAGSPTDDNRFIAQFAYGY